MKIAALVLYADLNGNGDLADDPPLRFEDRNGKRSLVYRTTVKGAQGEYPVEIMLELITAPKLALSLYDRTLRPGTIRVAGADFCFGLLGMRGVYNDEHDEVLFDLNKDGNFDTQTRNSPEVYSVSEKYANVGGVSYGFIVDPYGRSLTAYRRLHDKGFEIIGVNGEDEESNFKSFTTEHGMTWPQIREEMEGPVQKLYRVESFPAYFLIGRDGAIVANSVKPKEVLDEIEKHVGGR